MGFRTNDFCGFCKGQPESLKRFCNDFEIYWYIISSKRIRLSLQNVLVGIVAETTDPLHLLLNYFIIIGKLFLWNYKNNQILPNIHGFRAKIVAKYATEKIISRRDFFRKKWTLSPIFLNSLFLSLRHFSVLLYYTFCQSLTQNIHSFVSSFGLIKSLYIH